MDADNIIATSANGMEFDNGLHQPICISEDMNPTSNGSVEIEGLAENLDDAVKLNDSAAIPTSKVLFPFMPTVCSYYLC